MWRLIFYLRYSIAELQTAESDREAMKTQAESTNREYDRLSEEMAKLQNELNEGSKKDE